MPSFFKSLKDRFQSSINIDAHPQENRERGCHPHRLEQISPISRISSISSISSIHHPNYDEDRAAHGRSRDRRGAISISEPQLGPIRKQRARDDDWDAPFDDPERRHTDGLSRSLSKSLNVGRLRISLDPPKSERDRSTNSRDPADPRRSRDIYLRKASPRSSGDQMRRDDPRRSGDRDISYRRSTDDHHRRRRKSSHPKECSRSRHDHRTSDSRIKPAVEALPPLPPLPPTRQLHTRHVSEDEKKNSDRSEGERRKVAERFQTDKGRSRREKEDHERRKDRERREREKRARSPKKDLPRLTAENLRATADEHDSDNGSKKSSLDRPLGDMTRTFLEGMVPLSETGSEKAERRDKEKKLREGVGKGKGGGLDGFIDKLSKTF